MKAIVSDACRFGIVLDDGRSSGIGWLKTLVVVTVAIGLLIGVNNAAAQAPPVTSGVQFWVHAGAGVSENADGVSLWADQSGNFLDATAVAGNEPTFIASEPAIGGLPTLRFDGNMDLLDIVPRIFPDNQSELTVFAVSRSDQSDNASLFSMRTGSNILQLDTQGGVPGTGNTDLGRSRFIVRNAADGGAGVPQTTNNSLGPYGLAEGDTNPSYFVWAGTLSANGTEKTAVVSLNGVDGNPVTNDFQTTDTTITSGAQQIGGVNCCNQLNWKGDIAEIIIYNRALDSNDFQSVNSHLMTKYSIPEPSSFSLLFLAALGWLGLFRKR